MVRHGGVRLRANDARRRKLRNAERDAVPSLGPYVVAAAPDHVRIHAVDRRARVSR